MNSRLLLGVSLALCVCLAPLTLAAQESAAAPTIVAASHVVPSLINYNGVLKDSTGRTLTSLTGVTFLLYKDEQGGAPLWMETQNVTPDKSGHYSVQLGAASKNGIPPDLFMNGEARWLALQIGTEPEQARTLLVAVPYAMKSIDAQTLGGLPPSAFVLAAPPTTNPIASSATTAPSPSSPSVPPPTAVTTNGGTANTISMFTGAATIANSILTQTGTTAINVKGKLNLPASGTATASIGFNSRPEAFVASVFNSGTASPVAQTFQWQAEPMNNNTSAATGTLNLLYATGASVPVETGLKISGKGVFTFVPTQTFPGAGTVTSVGLSAPASDFSVTGSPVTKTGTLTLAWKAAPTNVDTANAIVKRDSTGSFNATNINASGQITVTSGTSLNPINVTATAANAAAIVGGSMGTGLTDGVLGASFSSGKGSSGVIGLDQNSNGSTGNYTTGVTGVTQNALGVGVLGYGVFSNNGQNDIGNYRAGVWGDDAAGAGVVATSDAGSGLIAANTSTAAPTLLAQNNTSASNSVIFRAAAPQVLSNGSSAFCQITTHGDMGCTGDIYQNSPANGLVKALVYFDPSQPAGSLKIVRCFNSALAEPAASTPPCGFTYAHLDVGINQIDFGFPVINRFPQVTAEIGAGVNGVSGLFGFPGAASQLNVYTFLSGSNNRIDAPFSLSVF